jgi:hypothetical protein
MNINKCDFSTFNKRKINYNLREKNNENNFGSYLAGLFEGDGTI